MAVLTSVQYETVINQLRHALRDARDEVELVAASDGLTPNTVRRRQIVAHCDLALGSARIIDEVPRDS
ncbi:hypothetical protein HOU02_gp472 [Caulobacter phage CcrBL9]|uniref:Uncharacterized protein n=1 Tax=Caulobacter phage CcrBL9 TaxID=2283270 RepID=A0A385EBU0_9CAUD|nr:hypothetical protein HOU02_gp472 [Caulobacter phage CcrBL9]AXQ69253.1 hypothetical protein CcrBL9_gp229c [Caulobacter phage CcrBL9]